MSRTLRPLRPLLAVVIALVAFSASAPATAAATGPRYPTVDLGDRGTDVRALQGLLTARGYPVAADGVFGPTTRDAVVAWETATGQLADGIVDDAAWQKLVIWLGPGATGPAVLAAQRELRAKRHLAVVANGVWGASTTAAVKAFQRHAGTGATGTMNSGTWRRLIAHFKLPSFNKTSLCDYSVGNGPANWATASAISALEAAARMFATSGRGRVAVGDIGLEHGGKIAGHDTHRRGLDVDIRLIRKAGDQCARGVNYRSRTYDRAGTRALIEAIRSTAPWHIKVIYFNDPVLIREGLTTHFTGHDDHLHVRYCEPRYPVAMYRC